MTHAGTARTEDGIVTAGGRVLNVTGLGRTPGEARDRAYEAADLIAFDGMQMRSDIAARAVERVAAALDQPKPARESRRKRRRDTSWR